MRRRTPERWIHVVAAASTRCPAQALALILSRTDRRDEAELILRNVVHHAYYLEKHYLPSARANLDVFLRTHRRWCLAFRPRLCCLDCCSACDACILNWPPKCLTSPA